MEILFPFADRDEAVEVSKELEEQGYQVISVVGGIQAYRGKQLEGNFH